MHISGTFATLRCGVSHSGGQTEPRNLENTPKNAKVLEELNSHRVFKRLAGFASCGFNPPDLTHPLTPLPAVLATWVLGLYQYYLERLGALYADNHTLKRTFLSWIFVSTTYNLGPCTVCRKHTDFANLPFGWCSVTALGNFNPKTGGHLVLWECGLVIEFPAGSTALLPSAVISHSNTAIAEEECRYSFTQYAAGALFRWVENAFQKARVFEASLTESEKETCKQENSTRFMDGLSYFPFLKRSTS